MILLLQKKNIVLVFSKWKDRGTKCVNIISNFHDTSVVHRKDHFGNKHLIKCPISIVDYNKYMGGVDHFDRSFDVIINITYFKTIYSIPSIIMDYYIRENCYFCSTH